jgi:hypothetical protein
MSTQGIAALFGMAANTIAAKIAHYRPAKAQLNPMLSDRNSAIVRQTGQVTFLGLR